MSTQPSGNQLQVNLGTLTLTKMIVLTKDAQSRTTIQQRYTQEVQPGICVIAPELCVNIPPSIAQPPANQSVAAGGTASFSVSASGSNPLSYQWQKNNVNLGNGGHYSDATTGTLTITGADNNDVASYRCVVTNAYGSATSSVATLTVTNNSNPPIITQPPANQTVIPGGTCSFTVAVIGATPLSYQWQKNNANLSNGGHYSGCTTNTLTIAGTDNNDVASYRCVVTNIYGSTNSSPATLTVSAGCNPVSLVNADFEGGTNANGVAVGWIGYQRTPNPTTIWTIQTASPPTGGGLQYQQIANTSSTGGGGVRQDVTGCTIGATYMVAGWMRGNSVSATCTVKCSPSASTLWTAAGDLTPSQTYTGPNWTAFSGTVVATGTSMTLWLDGQTGGSGLNKAECFDSVTVTCANAPASLHFDSVTLPAPNQVRLVLTGTAGGSVTIQRSSNLVNWLPLTSLINTNGTLQFTDTSTTNVPQRFYRATSP